MKKEELARKLLLEIAAARTTQDLRKSVDFCNEQLEESHASLLEKRAFFDGVILKAQDNSASMSNAETAQEIVNQVLGRTGR